MAARAVNTVSDRQSVRNVFEVDAMDQIIASNRQLAKQIHELQKQVQEGTLMQVSSRGCVTCGGPNCGEQCLEIMAEEEAKYMGHQAPYSKPYNNQDFSGQGARPQEQNSGKRSMEEMIEIFMARQDENIKKQEDANNRRDAAMREQQAAMRNLENQLGQMA